MKATRRGLFGLFLAAPAIIAAPSLMRVSALCISAPPLIHPTILLTSDYELMLDEAMLRLENNPVVARICVDLMRPEFVKEPLRAQGISFQRAANG